ncbi:hypothetical protein HH310_01380 [Actinoplanes sp. TBRC 11911]|uniref:hypothetical protein n=1 Tax=Actinoplanes sp. TBRC 11911 TaxID=2729386 RepID=UPI00145DB763|nr:hypothetical protein [Actinoplanes sp. TBRC 11911]NMO49852.1 hypothetical protein [Actinoplanes sp. TBRC 11911]
MSDPYYRLLFAYPRRYRRERGRELVDMYRELSGDRRPTFADAADLVLGGFRERLRTAGLGGVPDALPVVAVFSLAALAGLSVYYLAVFEINGQTTAYAFPYAGWLLTAVAAAAGRSRLARTVATVSLVLLAVAIALRFTSWPTLRLYMGLPLAVLAVLALFLPGATSRASRLAPLTVAAAVAVAAAVHLPLTSPAIARGRESLWNPVSEYGVCCNYQVPSSYVMHLAALAMLAAGLVVAVTRRRGSGWILLVLATPVAALLTMWLSDVGAIRQITYRFTGLNELDAVLASLLGVLVTGVALPAGVALVNAVRQISWRTRDADPDRDRGLTG